jgi:uncharacterized protein (TIRG00374 family)
MSQEQFWMMRFLRILISIGLLILMIRMAGDVQALGRQIAALSTVAIGLALLLNTLDRALMAYKWIRLLNYRGHHMGLLRGIRIYCASTIWGLFLPATLGADSVRAACTVREGIPAREVVASIAVERIIGGLATPLLAIGGLTLIQVSGNFDPRLESVWWIALAVIALGVAALVVAFDLRFHKFLHYRLMGRVQHFRLFQLLEKAHESFYSYRSARGELGFFFLLTLAENSFPIVITWVIAQGLGISAPFVSIAAAVPLAYLAARVPISMGGIGVYETVFVLVLSAAGVPLEDSLSMALIARVLQIVSWTPWWLAYMAEGGRPKPDAGDALPG